MRVDKILETTIARVNGGSVNSKFSRGKISGLLITGLQAVYTKDFLTVKLRDLQGPAIPVQRISLFDLDAVSNFKYGVSTTGTGGILRSALLDIADASWTGGNATKMGYVNRMDHVSAIYVDLGHITLDTAELDISLELQPQ